MYFVLNSFYMGKTLRVYPSQLFFLSSNYDLQSYTQRLCQDSIQGTYAHAAELMDSACGGIDKWNR